VEVTRDPHDVREVLPFLELVSLPGVGVFAGIPLGVAVGGGGSSGCVISWKAWVSLWGGPDSIGRWGRGGWGCWRCSILTLSLLLHGGCTGRGGTGSAGLGGRRRRSVRREPISKSCEITQADNLNRRRRLSRKAQ